MEVKTKQTMAIVLSILGSVGTFATAFLTRKAAKKELLRIDEINSAKNADGEIPKKDLVKEILPIYVPSLIVGGATVASIIGSTIMSRRAEASLTAMALLADQGWRRYKGQVKSKLGLDKHTDTLKGIGQKEYLKKKIVEKKDDRQLYFEDHIGFFKADPEKFALAFSDLNQRLQLEEYGVTSNYVMLYNLMKDSEAEILDKDLDIQNLRWGWSAEYLSETCGYVWVHLNMFDTETENGKKFKTVVWGEDPYLDPGNSGVVFMEKEEQDPVQFKSAIPKRETAVVDYELE